MLLLTAPLILRAAACRAWGGDNGATLFPTKIAVVGWMGLHTHVRPLAITVNALWLSVVFAPLLSVSSIAHGGLVVSRGDATLSNICII